MIISSSRVVTADRNGPAPETTGDATTDRNNEDRELTPEELEGISGGRMKIPTNPAVLAWDIAKCQAENPGFC
jgi:hypothetical protein